MQRCRQATNQRDGLPPLHFDPPWSGRGPPGYQLSTLIVDNLEKAIAAYEASLGVYTREALPQDWAATQNNLGGAYRDRIRGDRADNLEKAIAAFEKALTVRTREAAAQEWAETQN